MRLVLNLIWLILSGFWLCLAYLFVGALFCITIIGIPLGIAAFRIGIFALWPFGQAVVPVQGKGAGSTIGNVIWFLLAGWWLALGHIIGGIALCLTIIGIPLGLANFKLVPVSIRPYGREIVSVEEAQARGVSVAGF